MRVIKWFLVNERVDMILAYMATVFVLFFIQPCVRMFTLYLLMNRIQFSLSNESILTMI